MSELVTINPTVIQLLSNLKKSTNHQAKPNVTYRPHSTAADPIRDEQDILKAKEWFLNQPQRYKNSHYNIRNYLLFIIGINCGRRIGDTLNLKISDFVNADGTFKTYLILGEQKTSKTAKIYINDSVKEGLTKYLSVLPENTNINDYLFQSRTKSYTYNGEVKSDSRITIQRANQIYQKMAKEIGLTDKGIHISTHSTRKTAGYRMIQSNPTNIRTLINVQKFFNHSNPDTTLRYVGIQQEEIDDLTKSICI